MNTNQEIVFLKKSKWIIFLFSLICNMLKKNRCMRCKFREIIESGMVYRIIFIRVVGGG